MKKSTQVSGSPQEKNTTLFHVLSSPPTEKTSMLARIAQGTRRFKRFGPTFSSACQTQLQDLLIQQEEVRVGTLPAPCLFLAGSLPTFR